LRRFLYTLIAGAAIASAVPATALAQGHDRGHRRDNERHHRHHARLHHRHFGRIDAPAMQNAGTVASFDGRTLAIRLNNGSTVSGVVNRGTEIRCVAFGREDRFLHRNDDHGGGSGSDGSGGGSVSGGSGGPGGGSGSGGPGSSSGGSGGSGSSGGPGSASGSSGSPGSGDSGSSGRPGNGAPSGHDNGDRGDDNGDRGDRNDNDRGDDNDNNDRNDDNDMRNCGRINLRPGTVVHEADLRLSPFGAIWQEVELVVRFPQGQDH
jgi:hypothetical protein